VCVLATETCVICWWLS